MGISERGIYRILERYNQETPLKRRKEFLDDTILATKMSANVTARGKTQKVKKAIQLLGEDLCDQIEENARLFGEKWN